MSRAGGIGGGLLDFTGGAALGTALGGSPARGLPGRASQAGCAEPSASRARDAPCAAGRAAPAVAGLLRGAAAGVPGRPGQVRDAPRALQRAGEPRAPARRGRRGRALPVTRHGRTRHPHGSAAQSRGGPARGAVPRAVSRDAINNPRQVRHALRYVLLNGGIHAARSGALLAPHEAATVDPCSSAACFDGWRTKPRVIEPWGPASRAGRARPHLAADPPAGSAGDSSSPSA